MRYGGRQKGTPNKKVSPLRGKALELGIDPFEVLLLFAKGDWKALGYPSEFDKKVSQGKEYQERVIDPSDRVNAAKEACKYIHPQLKAVEHSGPDGQAIAIPLLILPSNGRELKED